MKEIALAGGYQRLKVRDFAQDVIPQPGTRLYGTRQLATSEPFHIGWAEARLCEASREGHLNRE